MKALYATAALIMTASSAAAQSPRVMRLEVRPFAGAYVPTGKLADDLKTAASGGVQFALGLSPRWHFLATGSWTNGHSKFGGMPNNGTDLWQYDAGAEFTAAAMPVGDWRFQPFVGLGAGGRTYDYRHVGMPSSTQLAGYAAIGHEMLLGSVGLRCEARDYVSRYESPITAKKNARNDLSLSAGIAFHF